MKEKFILDCMRSVLLENQANWDMKDEREVLYTCAFSDGVVTLCNKILERLEEKKLCPSTEEKKHS